MFTSLTHPRKQLDRVSFAIARELKSMGFNYPCNYYYDASIGGRILYFEPNFHQNEPIAPDEYSAPEVALALQWVLHETTVSLCFPRRLEHDVDDGWECGEIADDLRRFDTYEQALAYLVETAVKKIKKNPKMLNKNLLS